MAIKRMNFLLGTATTFFVGRNYIDLSMVDCSSFSDLNNGKKLVLSLKKNKLLNDNFIVYFDAHEAVKKLDYCVADSNDWIRFKNSYMNMNIPKNCIARGNLNGGANVIVSKTYVIGTPLFIFSIKKMFPKNLKFDKQKLSAKRIEETNDF